MKKINLLLLAVMVAAGFVSCSKDDEAGVTTDTTLALKKELLSDFTNNTVLATYSAMADNAIDFYDDCAAILANPSDQLVTAATLSWKATREHWEKSEAFLFGPANYNNLDPLIDSWPLDKNQLDQVLARPDILEIDPSFVRDNLGASLRGFHAVEYVLFRDGAPRPVADITQAELAYLVAVAAVLRDDCITLEAAWTGTGNITAQKQAFLEEAGIETGSVFGYEVINAGASGSRYASVDLAISEMIQGCIDIADEVGNAKIAEPAQSGNVLDVESWYSWNSLSDFKNNIRSIENAYLGGIDGSRGKGLTHLVQPANASLDTEIKSLLADAIVKIDAIGEPFRNNLDNDEAITAAIGACSSLMTALGEVSSVSTGSN